MSFLVERGNKYNLKLRVVQVNILPVVFEERGNYKSISDMKTRVCFETLGDIHITQMIFRIWFGTNVTTRVGWTDWTNRTIGQVVIAL